MFALLNRFRRCRRGSPAVEFALLAPILILVVGGIIELGLLLSDQTTLEKSVRAGAVAGARLAIDRSGGTPAFVNASAAQTLIDCVVKKGVPNCSGSDPYKLPGWTDGSAAVTVTLRYDTVTDGTNPVDVVVIRVVATLPHTPLVPDAWNFFGGRFVNTITLEASDEQAYIGN